MIYSRMTFRSMSEVHTTHVDMSRNNKKRDNGEKCLGFEIRKKTQLHLISLEKKIKERTFISMGQVNFFGVQSVDELLFFRIQMNQQYNIFIFFPIFLIIVIFKD